MALFIANRAFGHELLDSAKMGIFLASVLSAAFGLSMLGWFTRRGALRGVQ
jgi:NhaA family Na+:H+ antiporter